MFVACCNTEQCGENESRKYLTSMNDTDNALSVKRSTLADDVQLNDDEGERRRVSDLQLIWMINNNNFQPREIKVCSLQSAGASISAVKFVASL